jgi:pimeloyl-ACP methyl ester carboxylesterase
MRNRDALFAAAAALGGLAGAVIATRVAQAYQRDQRIALARLTAQSDLLPTARGPVEYAEAPRSPGAPGTGGAAAGRPAVLVIHGAAGGFDQSLHTVSVLGEAGLRFIAPSRFGYLRSPLPPNATPEAQADTLAALLDALGIEQAAVLAVSAGGMTAAAFALRHPQRLWALALVSAITRPLVVSEPSVQALTGLVLRSDFAFWAIRQGGLRLAGRTTGLSAAEQARLEADPEARRALEGILDMDPISRRRDGILNDTVQAEVLPEWPLAQIAAPTLVIHGTADPLVPYSVGQAAAAAIPGAQLLALEGAGHLGWFTHAAEARPATLAFLAAHAPR